MEEKVKYIKMEAEVAEVTVEKGYCASDCGGYMPPMPFDPPFGGGHGHGHHHHGGC